MVSFSSCDTRIMFLVLLLVGLLVWFTPAAEIFFNALSIMVSYFFCNKFSDGFVYVTVVVALHSTK